MAKGMSDGCWTIFKATRQGAEERVIRGVQMYRQLTSAGLTPPGALLLQSNETCFRKKTDKNWKSRQKWVKNRQKLVWPPRPRVGSCSGLAWPPLVADCGFLWPGSRAAAAAARGWQEVSGGCQVRLLMELYECGAGQYCHTRHRCRRGLYINHCTRTRGENNMTESEHFSSHPWLSLMFIFAKGNE